jgi:hypothetical protein
MSIAKVCGPADRRDREGRDVFEELGYVRA